MDSFTIILILNGVFLTSFFLVKNIFLSLILTVFAFFAILFFSHQKKINIAVSPIKLTDINFNNKQYITTILCLIVFVVLENFIGFTAALFIAFIIFCYQFGLDGRASYFVTLITLIITALFSIGGNTKAAEDTAILAYYFLVVGTVWQIIEIRKQSDSEQIISDVISGRPIQLLHHRKNIIQKTDNKQPFIILAVLILVSLTTLFFVFGHRLINQQTKKTVSPVVPSDIEVTATPKLRHNVPFEILNATKIRGLAASAAASLLQSGWDSEFDISIGNSDASISANILNYTENLASKKELLERNLNIVVTPVIIKNSTREAEMILILGK